MFKRVNEKKKKRDSFPVSTKEDSIGSFGFDWGESVKP